MSYAHHDEAIYVNGRPVPPTGVSTCPRCSLPRLHNSRRERNTLCVDCRSVENPSRELLRDLARMADDEEPGKFVRRGLIWHWEPAPAPMSADDLAWAERAADDHFWHRWETANRRTDANPLQLEAEKRARKYEKTTQPPQKRAA